MDKKRCRSSVVNTNWQLLLGKITLIVLTALFVNKVIAAPDKNFSQITIVLHYDNASTQAGIWAFDEKKIDFRDDPFHAGRCTAAFTATELAHFLEQTLEQTTITYSKERPKNNFFIELMLSDPSSRDCSFTIEPVDNGIRITGKGRTGLLYGGYELLRLQGWRWYAPGDDGQIAPQKSEQLILPNEKKSYSPDMPLGRGLHVPQVSKESTDLWMWMARNRLNVLEYKPATGPLACKLGMIFQAGGHIFERLLNPDRIMPSGKILWDEHREWFGLPKDGKWDKEAALRTQFCVSQPELVPFFGEELIDKLMGEWKEADMVNLWGFDTWGNTCSCEECRALGNSTDQSLHFFSQIRDYINHARQNGKLDHDLKMILCAYEGTSTMEGPERPFPENLAKAGDMVVFYPIDRSYADNLYDKNNPRNAWYNQELTDWRNSSSPAPGVFFGEYYNVSKYEDLPLLFTETMRVDIPGHFKAGCRGMVYMHVPFVNWGSRTLTQVLYAQLSWDVSSDVDSFLDEYFTNWYGPHKELMKHVYTKTEKAWKYIAEWRNWHHSIIHPLLKWDGTPPDKELASPPLFGSIDEVIESGRQSIQLIQETMSTLEGLREKHFTDAPYIDRISEDYRLIRYGLHTMELMTYMLAYHEAMYRGNQEQANSEWTKIRKVADELDSYWIPIGFCSTPKAGVESKDALSRTQYKKLVQQCMEYRIKEKLPLQ